MADAPVTRRFDGAGIAVPSGIGPSSGNQTASAFGRRLTVDKELGRSLMRRTSVALARFLIYLEVRAAKRITDVRDTLLDERRFA
jgi:hypothetical protein